MWFQVQQYAIVALFLENGAVCVSHELGKGIITTWAHSSSTVEEVYDDPGDHAPSSAQPAHLPTPPVESVVAGGDPAALLVVCVVSPTVPDDKADAPWPDV